jgi:DNA-binding CsgD family transcriptional regulator
MQISNIDTLFIRTRSGDRRAANHLARHLLTKFKPLIDSAARRIGIAESMSLAGLSLSEALAETQPGNSIESLFVLRFKTNLHSHQRTHTRRVTREDEAGRLAALVGDDLEDKFAVFARLENAPLSNREREIVLARLRGETFKQIGESLKVSTAAVGAALSRIFKKLENANELTQ